MSSDIYGSQFESILQSLEQMETALQKEIDKDEKANREAAEKQAEAARRGELGEDWRKVQERIDSAGRCVLRSGPVRRCARPATDIPTQHHKVNRAGS